MTELVFFSKPILLLIPLIFGLLQIILARIPKTVSLVINAVLFAAAVALLVLLGGQLSDILATLLFASLLSFVFSEALQKSNDGGKGDDRR